MLCGRPQSAAGKWRCIDDGAVSFRPIDPRQTCQQPMHKEAGAESVAIFFRPPIHFQTFLSRLRRSFPPHNRRPFRQISLDIVVNISTAHWCPPHNFIARPRCRIVGLFSGGRRLKGGRCSSADQTDVHIPSPDWFRQNRYISTWQPL